MDEKDYSNLGEKEFYCLGISGSPRRGGNSETLLDEALSGAASAGAVTEKVILNELKFRPCQECDSPGPEGSCKLEDDLRSVFPRVRRANALIVASPVFFGSLSAQTKMFVDRFQCVWRGRYVLRMEGLTRAKRGGFICVQAGQRKDFFACSRGIVRNLFAVIEARYEQELFVEEVESRAQVRQKPESMQQAFELGRALARRSILPK